MRAIAWFLAWLLIFANAGTVATVAVAADGAPIAVRTGEHADHSRIVFDWTSVVGIKVETPETGQLVVSFDRPAQFDLSQAAPSKLTRVAAIEPVDGRTAIRIRLRGRYGHSLTKVGFKVVLDILDDGAGSSLARKAITKKTAKKDKQDQAEHKNHGTAASSPVDAASSGRSVDAHADDTPLLVQSSGTPAAAERPDVLSASRPQTEAAREPIYLPAEPAEPIPDPLFDPASWHGNEGFMAGNAELAKRLAENPQDGATLLALAQRQFAWRHADEALSVIDSLAAVDAKRAKRIDIRALADAAHLLAGRPGKTTGAFERAGLKDRPEARLWQGAKAALSGDSDAAFAAFEAGKAELERYPPRFRAFFGLLALQAAIDSGAFGPARTYETIVQESQPEPDDAAMLAALTGLRLARQQQPDEALPYLSKALRSPALKPQIIARLALIAVDRTRGRLDAAATADALEQLYVSWEGDGLQLDILDQLVAAYATEGRYDDAFDAVALAQHQFPGDPRAKRMAAAARDLFRRILTGGGKGLDAIQAKALYDEHPELMPDGSDAAAIRQGLARQLAGLDLEEPAVELYNEALTSASADQQAEIGTELAKLRAAANEAGVPEQTAATDAGAVPIETRQRADANWRSGAWDQAAADYLLAADEAADGDARKARLILRATAALLLAGKADEAQALRERYGSDMAKSTIAAAFDQLTAPGAGVELLALPEVSAAVVKLD